MRHETHPALSTYTLTFDPGTYTYRDQEGSDYIFATAFVSRFFPEFDQAGAAARVSARTGRPVPAILAEWKAKADASKARGNAVHKIAEEIIAGRPTGTHRAPQDWPQAVGVVSAALETLRASYDIWQAEALVFDPLYRLAGFADLVGCRRDTGALWLGEWKCVEKITEDAFGRTALAPIEHVGDSKLARYALQLSTYAWIMLDSGYVPAGTEVELGIIHLPPGCSTPNWLPVPYMGDEVAAMVEHWMHDGPGAHLRTGVPWRHAEAAWRAAEAAKAAAQTPTCEEHGEIQTPPASAQPAPTPKAIPAAMMMATVMDKQAAPAVPAVPASGPFDLFGHPVADDGAVVSAAGVPF
jgi:hypothetical protein